MKTSNKIIVSFFTVILGIIFLLILISRLTLRESGWHKNPLDFQNMSFEELKELNSRYIDFESDTVSAAHWKSIFIHLDLRRRMDKAKIIIRNLPDSNISYRTAFYKKDWGVVKLILDDEVNRIDFYEENKTGCLKMTPRLEMAGVIVNDAGSEFKAQVYVPEDIPLEIKIPRLLAIECANPTIRIHTWPASESFLVMNNSQLISGQFTIDSIKLKKISGVLELRTEKQIINLTQVSTYSTKLESIDGNIIIKFDNIKDGSQHRIISNSGDIHLVLPLNSQQHISAHTSKGKLTLFGNEMKTGSHSGGHSGATFIIESVSGNIVIDRM